MSIASQTQPARRPAWLGPRTWISALAATAILIAAMGLPAGGTLLGTVGQARPHAPDLVAFSSIAPVIKIHLLAALAALALGAVLMLVRKGRRFHRVAGWMWVALVFTVAASSIFITSLNHGRWSLIHLFTGWVMIALPLAVLAAKRRNVTAHRKTMTGLFYGGFALNLFIAFIPGRTLWNLFFG